MATKQITTSVLQCLVLYHILRTCCAETTQKQFVGYSSLHPSTEYVRRKTQLQSREVSHPLEWVTTSPNISEACRTGWQYLWTHNQLLLKAKPSLGKTSLAERALDAFGKPVGGALLGGLSSYGSFDECLSTDHVQYCIVPSVATSLPRTLPVSKTVGMIGICMPRECTEKDAAVTVQIYLYPLHVQGYLIGGPYYVVSESTLLKCTSERQPPYSNGAIVMIVLCSVFLAAALVGTSVHWALDKFKPADKTQRSKAPALLLNLVTSFSLRKNIPALISTKSSPSSIRCLHGIRVISMLWIILFHSPWLRPINNSLYYEYDVKKRTSHNLVAQQRFSIAVSSFFLLSGLLVTYQRMRDMDKRKGHFSVFRYYVHRYLRLTPTYMFILLFYWFLFTHLSEGPRHSLYATTDNAAIQLCERYWWKSLLYINNFFPDDACMNWGWYLSLDLQFYYVSPLLIVLLYHSLPLGLTATGIFFAGSVAANGAIAGYYSDGGFDDNPTIFSEELTMTPYGHIAPWLAGIVVGYMFFKRVKIPTTFHGLTIPSWIITLVLRALAGGLLLSVLFGIPRFDSLIVTALFREPMWGIGLALVVYSCHAGYGGLVNSFLSMNIWLPFSRLTFCTFLINPIVIFSLEGNLRDPIRYTDLNFASHVVAVAVLSFAAAAVIVVFVEFPFTNLEQLLFGTLERMKTTCTGGWSRAATKDESAEELPLTQVSKSMNNH